MSADAVTDHLVRPAFTAAIGALGDGPLTDDGLRAHIAPLFSRVLAGDRPIYLANHSLGRPPDATAEDVAASLDAWYTRLGDAWDLWLERIEHFRALWARVIGRGRVDAVVPKTAAGQGLRAVLNALPARCPKVVATRGEFDSIDFVLKAYNARGRAEVRWVEGRRDGTFHGSDVADAIEPGTDLVIVSRVPFVTGQVLPDLESVVSRAHAVGARVVLDTYHAAGVMPMSVDDIGADFAIGGSYKYTRGGPGACWLSLSDAALADESLVPIDTGWFAKPSPFSYERPDEPAWAEGGNGWLESTPPVLPFVQAIAGLELMIGIGIDRLRAHNLGQQARLADALRAQGVEPCVLGEQRGAYTLIESRDPTGFASRLRDRGVVTDARPCPVRSRIDGTGYVRLCPDMLTTGEELEAAARAVGEVARG